MKFLKMKISKWSCLVRFVHASYFVLRLGFSALEIYDIFEKTEKLRFVYNFSNIKKRFRKFETFRKNGCFWLAKNRLYRNRKNWYQRIRANFLFPTVKFLVWSTIFEDIDTSNLNKCHVYPKLTTFLQNMPRNRFAELCELHLIDSFRWWHFRAKIFRIRI